MSRPNIVLGKTSRSSVPLIRVPEAAWLKDCVEQRWDGRSPIGTGAYVSRFDGIDFHMCFHRSDSGSSRVLVSLTSGRYGSTRDDGPRFNRWKYVEVTDASVLCIDDPMVYLYSIKYGWFAGGTEAHPMWASLGKLIVQVCSAAGIEGPDILFLSSSSGGTAAILASSALGIPCTVVAINPQICLPNATRYSRFMARGYLCPLLKDPDFLFKIIRDHAENRYVVMCNIASARDYDRYFTKLCGFMGIQPVYGISRHSNLVTWVYDAPSSKPHEATDWRTFYPAIEFVAGRFDDLDEIPGNLLDMFTSLLGEHHVDQDRIAASDLPAVAEASKRPRRPRRASEDKDAERSAGPHHMSQKV